MIITPDEVFHGIQLYGAIHVIYFVAVKLVLKLGKKLNDERHHVISAHYENKHTDPVSRCFDGFCHKLSA